MKACSGVVGIFFENMHLLLRYGASSDVFFSSKPLDPLFGDGQDPSDIPERSDVYTEHNEDAVLRGREKLVCVTIEDFILFLFYLLYFCIFRCTTYHNPEVWHPGPGRIGWFRSINRTLQISATTRLGPSHLRLPDYHLHS